MQKPQTQLIFVGEPVGFLQGTVNDITTRLLTPPVLPGDFIRANRRFPNRFRKTASHRTNKYEALPLIAMSGQTRA